MNPIEVSEFAVANVYTDNKVSVNIGNSKLCHFNWIDLLDSI